MGCQNYLEFPISMCLGRYETFSDDESIDASSYVEDDPVFCTYFETFFVNIAYLTAWEFQRLYEGCQTREPDAMCELRYIAGAPITYGAYDSVAMILDLDLLVFLEYEHGFRNRQQYTL